VNISFDIYVAVMQRKYIYFNYSTDPDEYYGDSDYDPDDDYDDYDNYASDECYVYSFGCASERYELRRKRERQKEAEKAFAKKQKEKEMKKLQIENTKKDMTTIISLEILKNKLNNDCLSNIASFLLLSGSSSLDPSIKQLKYRPTHPSSLMRLGSDRNPK
jgi:hypothetical protein